jgi:hypothetical protein
MSKAKAKRKAGNGPVIALLIGGIALLGLLIYGAMASTKQADEAKKIREMVKPPNQNGCASSPVPTPAGVEHVICQGQKHVTDGQKVKYDTDPPLSGDHWNVPTNPGFYSEAQTPERLVHSLEHGNVVIYYDPAKLPAADLDAVKALARKYTGPWDGVIAVPRTDAKNAVTVTAWENALRLENYDKARAEQFVELFRGRGPENPVRPLP